MPASSAGWQSPWPPADSEVGPALAEHAGKQGGTGTMHGVARRRFDGLQVEAARLPLTGTKNLQQRVYFGGDYLLDRRRRFFPGASRIPPPGELGRSFR